MEFPNLTIIDRICAEIDRAFTETPELARRFPDAPAARGEPSAVLKNFVADRKGHDRRYAIDDDKIKSELGYAPRCDFGEGLQRTVQWYLSNEIWWRAVLDGSYARHVMVNQVI